MFSSQLQVDCYDTNIHTTDAGTSTSDWDSLTIPVEVAPASNARQEVSSHSAGVSTPASHIQPVFGRIAEAESTIADTVTTLNAFSRLPPERMRTLIPVLTDIMASRQPSDPEAVPGTPPS